MNRERDAKMNRLILTTILVALPLTWAAAQEPPKDPVLDRLGSDFSAFENGQQHFLESLQEMIKARTADQARVRNLQSQLDYVKSEWFKSAKPASSVGH